MKNQKWIGFLQAVTFFFIIILEAGFSYGEVFNLESQQHSLGIDLIRTADKAQYGGMFNLIYQCSVNSQWAVTLSASYGNRVTLAEGGLKFYIDRYFDGPYIQAGGVVGDYKGDSEVGLTAAFGYEVSLNRNFVLGVAAEVTGGGMKHPVTGERVPIFRPCVSLIYAF